MMTASLLGACVADTEDTVDEGSTQQFEQNELRPKHEHHVRGTVNGLDLRGVVEPLATGRGVALGPAWRRDRHLESGATVDVMLEPEGPQRDDLAADIAAAFAANPAAGAFFDSIAQFYRRAYLRYIDATKRRPDERATRIAEVVERLAAGEKERPKQ